MLTDADAPSSLPLHATRGAQKEGTHACDCFARPSTLRTGFPSRLCSSRLPSLFSLCLSSRLSLCAVLPHLAGSFALGVEEGLERSSRADGATEWGLYGAGGRSCAGAVGEMAQGCLLFSLSISLSLSLSLADTRKQAWAGGAPGVAWRLRVRRTRGHVLPSVSSLCGRSSRVSSGACARCSKGLARRRGDSFAGAGPGGCRGRRRQGQGSLRRTGTGEGLCLPRFQILFWEPWDRFAG